jgi:hypothetical protein
MITDNISNFSKAFYMSKLSLKKTPDADKDDDEDRRRYGGLLTLAQF